MNRAIFTIVLATQLTTYNQLANARTSCVGICLEIQLCQSYVDAYPDDEDSFNIELSFSTAYQQAYCVYQVGLVPPPPEEEVVGSNGEHSIKKSADATKLTIGVKTDNENYKDIGFTIPEEKSMVLVSSKGQK
jgi:hypothetical protein